MQCHALYLWPWPRPGGMRLQLGETRRVAGQRHQRTLPVVTPAWPSPGASARPGAPTPGGVQALAAAL